MQDRIGQGDSTRWAVGGAVLQRLLRAGLVHARPVGGRSCPRSCDAGRGEGS